VVALSGGVQPWMKQVCQRRQQLAIFNAYLPEALPLLLSGQLMHANAHPSSTDFFAACRIEGKQVRWLCSTQEVLDYACAWQAASRLKSARFLKVGETEPWVINSCRDPQTIADTIGCEVIPVEREALYKVYETISDEEATAEAKRWNERSDSLTNISYSDILKACKVTIAMPRALDEHQADGLSMACFAMIGDIDTTSCLALSALKGKKPVIAVIRVGEDPGSVSYVRKKEKTAAKSGIGSRMHVLPDSISQEEIFAQIDALNADSDVNGILIQAPLPKHINETATFNRVLPGKDVDGFNTVNIGKLCQEDSSGFVACRYRPTH